MIEKVEAIVLRFEPVSNTSRVVTWLTAEHGRIATMIKGSLRPKSQYIGQYDLFYTCELLFYPRPHDRLFIARECSPLAVRPNLRTDWRATAVASYLAGAVSRVSPPHAPSGSLYRFLNEMLDDLNNLGFHPSMLYWAELKLLDLLGHAPRLDTCLTCHRPARADRGKHRLSIARGGLVCGDCSRVDGHASEAVSPEVLAALTAWQRADHSRIPRLTRTRPAARHELGDLLGHLVSYHLNLDPAPRLAALDICSRQVGKDGRIAL